MRSREGIARRYGYETFAELLDMSSPLPAIAGEKVRAYVARHKNGYWFIWEDAPPEKFPEPDDDGRALKRSL